MSRRTSTTSLSSVHLVLMLGRGTSLALFDHVGMLEREIALYNAIRPHIRKLTIVSAGGSWDMRYTKDLPDINIVTNKWLLPYRAYSAMVTKVMPRFWGKNVIVKSNQLPGAEEVLAAARTAGGKAVLRCGYMYALNVARAHGKNSQGAREAAKLEKAVFPLADHCIVTEAEMRDLVINYGVPPERVDVVPNYIVEPLFAAPASIGLEVLRIGFAGRLEKEKNILNLLAALEGLPVTLELIGEGSLRPQIEEKIRNLGLSVRMHGNIPHRQLIGILTSCDLYLQPSLYEGHPKTILEAMAAGLPVIVGDSPGIANFIRHGKNGYLCGHKTEAIRTAVMTVSKDMPLRKLLAKEGRKYALETVGLSRIVPLELDIYQKILDRSGR
ncbi:glycosyltransferase family 4 protein [Pseudodesulfovibrio sp.]|uniref:glycosyltransferase family 4 protein n=1 Tax=unclassified Pseudodesulfovibrio TaxID=2661612 RepID=UPI003B00E4A8